MWFLTNSEGTRIYLGRDKTWTFGRKRGEILLENDESISRLHASLIVTTNKPVKDREPGSTCTLQDHESKYGTYVSSNDEHFVRRLSSNLENQDKIRFGLQNHIYIVHHVPFITAMSTVNEEDKMKLESLIDEIDGIISEDWTTTCTHLTVSDALLTEKVVWSMAAIVPIVTITYWEHVKEAIDKGAEIPKVDNFVPPIGENLINKNKVSLIPNPARKSLFKDLIFIFFSAKQFKVYGKMVYLAGGKSVVYGKKPLTFKDFCLPNVVSVQFPDDEASQASQEILPEYDEIYDQMREKNLRIVPETEIPLAILHCSIKTYCNPRHKFKLRFETRVPDLGKVLVPDTQDVEQDIRVLPTIISDIRVKPSVNRQNPLLNVIIPETCDFLNDEHIVPESDDIETEKELQTVAQVHSNYEPETEDRHPRLSTEKRSPTNYDSKTGDKHSRLSTEKRSPILKEGQILEKSLIEDNTEEKVALPIKTSSEDRKGGIIIPETLDTLDDSSKRPGSSMLLSPEVSITVSPKKKHVPVKHMETISKTPDRSPTMSVSSRLSPSQSRISPVCCESSNTVMNWLARTDRVIEETLENTGLSPVKSPARNNDSFGCPVTETPIKKSFKKRNRASSSFEDDPEFIPPTKKSLRRSNSLKKETISPTEAFRKIMGLSPPCLRLNPQKKHFQKAKILIPAERISIRSMTTW